MTMEQKDIINSDTIEIVKTIIPELSFDSYKGQSCRVGVLGGCREYTGAPYYAAISALRTGVDLCHVFCTEGAATPIKSYSPELIVHPVMPDTLDESKGAIDDSVAKITKWFSALDVLVVGPGLGRDEHVLSIASLVIQKALDAHLPLVIDGDGLWLVSHNLSLVRGHPEVILTPNMVEYSRLAAAVAGKPPKDARATDDVPDIKDLARSLDGPTIMQKGARCAHGADLISDANITLHSDIIGSPRRCGGQGDVLAGCTAAFFAWLNKHNKGCSDKPVAPAYAAYGGSATTRRAAEIAFGSMKRSLLTTDIIQCICEAFEGLYDPDSFHEHDDD